MPLPPRTRLLMEQQAAAEDIDDFAALLLEALARPDIRTAVKRILGVPARTAAAEPAGRPTRTARTGGGRRG